MKTIENCCVGCPQGCINCGRNKVETVVCDVCEDASAVYSCDGTDFCEECLEGELDSLWKDFSLTDKIEAMKSLDYEISEIDY